MSFEVRSTEAATHIRDTIPRIRPVTVFNRAENAARTVLKGAAKAWRALETGTGKAFSHPPTVPLKK
jgi:hypothetical protein